MIKIKSVHVMSEEEQRRIELEWVNSDEKVILDRNRKRIQEAMNLKKSCHSY